MILPWKKKWIYFEMDGKKLRIRRDYKGHVELICSWGKHRKLYDGEFDYMCDNAIKKIIRGK